MRERQGRAIGCGLLLSVTMATTATAQDAAPLEPLSAVPGLERVQARRVRNVMLLQGEVAREADKELAGKLAAAEPGVADVVNRIEIDRSASARLLPALKASAQRLLRLLGSLPLLLVAAFVAWLAWRVGGWIAARPFIGTRLVRNAFLADLARQVIRVAAALAGLLVALEILDAMALAAALLGSAGVAGIALGFAFRDLLENYIASIMLSLRQPFAPDDFVKIDTYEGTVVGMNSRATVLMTADGNHLRLPSSQAQQAMAAGLEAVRGTPGVLDQPAAFVQLAEVTRDELRLQFFAWVDQAREDFFGVRSEALRRARARLKTMGVDFGPPAMRLVTEAAPSVPPAAESENRAPPEPREREQEGVRDAVQRTRAEMAGGDLMTVGAARE
jgi:small conductance mechanosensitive channel